MDEGVAGSRRLDRIHGHSADGIGRRFGSRAVGASGRLGGGALRRRPGGRSFQPAFRVEQKGGRDHHPLARLNTAPDLDPVAGPPSGLEPPGARRRLRCAGHRGRARAPESTTASAAL